MKILEWLKMPVKPKHVIPVGDCKHPEWLPEVKENGWREVCKVCGQRAYGSCQ